MFDQKAYIKVYNQKPENKRRRRERIKALKEANPNYEREREERRNHYLRRLAGRENNYLIKLKVLMHYSNPIGAVICNNCGEQDPDILCLDHIEGGGSRQYRELNRRGTEFYNWLVKTNYPKGYQVLCYNCNVKKRRFDVSRNRNFVQ